MCYVIKCAVDILNTLFKEVAPPALLQPVTSKIRNIFVLHAR